MARVRRQRALCPLAVACACQLWRSTAPPTNEAQVGALACALRTRMLPLTRVKPGQHAAVVESGADLFRSTSCGSAAAPAQAEAPRPRSHRKRRQRVARGRARRWLPGDGEVCVCSRPLTVTSRARRPRDASRVPLAGPAGLHNGGLRIRESRRTFSGSSAPTPLRHPPMAPSRPVCCR